MNTLDVLPESFSELSKAENEWGIATFDTVLDPLLIVDVEKSGDLKIRLTGVKHIRGNEVVLDAPSLSHDYVVSEKNAYPLPSGINQYIKEKFSNKELKALSLPDFIKAVRDESFAIDIRLTDAVIKSGKDLADSMGDIFDIPKGLRADLYKYQKNGVAWLVKNLLRDGGAIIADEMGLGKTIQVIATILCLDINEESPVLIVCPTSLIANWKSEIEKFAPELSVAIHRGPERAGIAKRLKTSKVVLSTYETIVIDELLVSAIKWKCVVCDEAQALKNPESNRRATFSNIDTHSWILMTGTPVETTLLDIWSLMDIAIPGVLGGMDDFLSEFPDNNESAEKLNDLVSPFILRRTVSDVAKDLPERIDIELPVELDEAQIIEYESIRNEAIEEYGVAGGLVATTRLSVFCAHPALRLINHSSIEGDDAVLSDLFDGSLVTSKLEVTHSILNEASREGKKVLIFSNYNKMFELIKETFKGASVRYWGAINGSTPQEERQEIINDFSSIDGSAVLVLNPKAAGAGLNITAATVVIHYTPVWNPALEMQASARAHRRGQENPVTIYKLFYKNTVEEVMIERARDRKELGDMVVPEIRDDKKDLNSALMATPMGK